MKTAKENQILSFRVTSITAAYRSVAKFFLLIFLILNYTILKPLFLLISIIVPPLNIWIIDRSNTFFLLTTST